MDGNISLDGAVDIHTHVGPSVYKRRVDAYECALECAEAGLDGVVFKEHHLPTQYGVPFVKRLLERDGYEDFEPMGSVVLNYANGAFNPFMVQSVIDYGAKVVWSPTIDAKKHAEYFGGAGQYASWISDYEESIPPEYEGKDGIYVLDDDGELKDDVKLCLEKMVDNDVVFCAGHSTYEETYAMFEYAADLGHDKLVLDHPTYFVTDQSLEEQQSIVDLGATVNWMFAAVSPKLHWANAEEYADAIRAIGVENSLVSSDMGQIANPSAPEGLRILGELLLENGFTADEYEQMVADKPKELLDMA